MPTKPTTPKAPTAAATARTTPRGARPKLVTGDDMAPAGADGEVEDKAGNVNPGMMLKTLVDKVVAATGAKKKDVKEVVEATLIQMGEALKGGENLNLPGLGKLRIVRRPVEGSGAMTLKLRQAGQGGGHGGARKNPDAEAIAEDADQD
ncbi:MAG: HU family DNA-binding protein [bacterium]